VRNDKFTIGSGSLSVYHPFWNPFSVEVREEIDEVKVLQEKGPIIAYSLARLWVPYRGTV